MATSTIKSPRAGIPCRPSAIALAVAGALVAAAPNSFALPTGGEVAAGQATISQPSASSLQITQGTQKAILNWQGFSIGKSESVNFTQPSASAVALNRVLGSNPSHIFGRLTANGQVFLSNPSGVIFGRTASVDVGGLVATTLSISDSDFLSGNYVFSNGGAAGAVINEGSIVTANGYTALIGPQVTNDGIIAARLGSVALAAADRVTLDMVGDGLISLSIDQAAVNAAAINSGTITADGGHVLLTARSANALLDTVVNNSGLIRANSLIERNGEIVLDGGGAGQTVNGGTLEAVGLESGTKGGDINVLGDRVLLAPGSRIDVSGDEGGGTALIGGDFQGKNPDVRNASYTSVAADASIKADAGTSGNGGKVIVWADKVTRYAGYISVRGGSASGDGGFVEVSGKEGLQLAGLVGHFDLSAPNGKGGQLLLDPNVINIVAAGTTDGCLATGSCDATGNVTLELIASDIEIFLNDVAGNNLTLMTSDDAGATNDNININAALDTSNTHGNILTFDADDEITGFGNLAGNNYTAVLKVALTGTVSKTYDGATNATLDTANYTIRGAFNTDTTEITQTAGSYTSKDVGDNNGAGEVSVSLGGSDYSSTLGANYTLPVTATGNVGEITPATVTLVGSRAYDGTMDFGAAAFGTFATGVLTETLMVTGTGSVTSKDVAAGTQPLTLGTLALADGTNGGLASNYEIAGAGNTGEVTPKALTAVELIGSVSKTYDGATTATLAAGNYQITGFVAGEGATISQTSGTYTSKDVVDNDGTGQVTSGTLNAGHYAADVGTDLSNYDLTAVTSTTATGTVGEITFKALTGLSLIGTVSKVYDGTATATLGTANYQVDGFVAGEGATIGVTTGTYDPGRNVQGPSSTVTSGTIQISDYTANGGTLLSNYDLAAVTNTTATGNVGQITQRPITVTAQSDTKTYDGNTSSAVAPIIAGGLGAGDSSGFSQTYDNKNVGTGKTMTAAGIVNDGNGGANYAVTFVTNGSGVINRLGSVSWVGSATGNWSVASNWAGNAIPDMANVADVDLNGATVTFDAAVPGISNTVSVDNVSGGRLSAAGGALTLSVANALDLSGYTQASGAVVVAGNLSVIGTSAINQSGGTLTVGGTSTLDAGANAITLNSASNNFTGSVTAAGNSIQITDTNALSVALTDAGSSTVQAGGNLVVSGGVTGTLDATTTSGTTTFGATSAGALVVDSASSIGQTGAISAGATNLTGTAITLTEANNFGAITVNAGTGNVSITENAAMSISGISHTGNLVLSAAGPITQTGAISISGTSGISAGANAITLTNGANDFGGTVTLSNAAGASQITDANAIAIGNSTLGGSLTVNSGGLITLGSVTTSGTQQYNNSVSVGGTYNTGGGNFSVTGATGVASGSTITTGAGNVMLAGAVNGPGALTINSSGATTFGSTVGQTTALASISTDIAGSTSLGGNVRTTGAISFRDPTNAAGRTLASVSNGAIRINVPAAGSSPATIDTSGNVTLDGPQHGSNGGEIDFTKTPNSLVLTQLSDSFFTGPAIPATLTFVPNSSVTYNGVLIAASIAQQQAGQAASAAQGSAAAATVQEANETFGTDSVAEQVEYGFAGDVGTTPPMDHRLEETGISVPACLEESREGTACR